MDISPGQPPNIPTAGSNHVTLINGTENGPSSQSLPPEQIHTPAAAVGIEGTYRRYCPHTCFCECHYKSTTLKSPPWLKKILGSFLFTYDCLPIIGRRTCNKKSCLNSDQNLRLSFLLPDWTWRRGVFLAVEDCLQFKRGASLSLEIPAIIAYSHPIWTPWPKREDEWMVNLLQNDNIQPVDCDESGCSVLYVGR